MFHTVIIYHVLHQDTSRSTDFSNKNEDTKKNPVFLSQFTAAGQQILNEIHSNHQLHLFKVNLCL